jgi:vancomycin resistance protein YoaR
MQVTPTPSQQHGQAGRRSRRWIPVVLLLLLILVLIPVAYQGRYRGRIHPGVTVAGIPVGGLEPADAVARLEQAGLDPKAPVSLRIGDLTDELSPNSGGIALDLRATVADAYAIGRKGPPPLPWIEVAAARVAGLDVQPRVLFDDAQVNAAVADLAQQIDRPVQDASLQVDGGTVHATSAAEGRQMDQAAAIKALQAAANAGVWPLPQVVLSLQVQPPTITDGQGVIATAQALLDRPLTLRADEKSWPLEPAALGPMLKTSVQGGTLTLDLDRQRLAQWLTPVTEVISHTAQSPRFHFDEKEQRLLLIEGGRAGEQLDVETTAQRILAAATDPRRVVPLATQTTPAPVSDTATAEELGIREVVREETSRYVGSPAERIHNIGVAASRFDGLLIPPDAVFSFNDNIGEITPETGYEKTKIIMDGATRDGVGGGVCQVSTTLFRTAFWAGLPIVERTPHGYRVAYYEQGAPVGLDATVFQPSPDLKFRNDTGAWLLIETRSDPRKATVTFRLSGTKPAREVRMEGPTIGKTTPPPPPRTEVDSTLPPGATKVIELARSGASVSVTRIIKAGDQEQREVFHSNYHPTGAVTAVGPQVAQQPPTPGAPVGVP